MKLNNTKFTTFLFSLATLFFLSACGTTGTSSNTNIVDGAIQGEAPYVIEAHEGSTAVVHAGGDHTGTHSWTQISGPTVTLTGTSTPTVTHTVPTGTTTPIVLQHTNTHPTTNVVTVTQHTVYPTRIPTSTSTLGVVVGKPQVVFSGDIASLHASAFGGTAPYTYDWMAPTNIALVAPHSNAPIFSAPATKTTEIITIGLQVMDDNGHTVSSNEKITITQKALLFKKATEHRTITDNNAKANKGGGSHSVSFGPFSITNPLPSEIYTWQVGVVHGTKSDLTDLKVSLDSTTQIAHVNFKIGTVTKDIFYGIEIKVKSPNRDEGYFTLLVGVEP